MSPSEHQELAEFVATAFDRQRVEMREFLEGFRKELMEGTRRTVAVSVEALRGEIRIVAEGVTDNGRRIEENRLRIEGNGDRNESLAERFDRVEHRLDDHESRLTSLE